MSLIQFNNEYLMFGDEYVGEPWVDPYNPLDLPLNTVRVRTSGGYGPVKCYAGNSNSPYTTFETATLVPGTTDVYDVYKSGTNFDSFLYGASNVLEVLGANTRGITNMANMFYECYNLASVALFDTSTVTNMNSMFYRVGYFMSAVPLFDTSNVMDMSYMLWHCVGVESGALALYQQASTHVQTHVATFEDCGSNTIAGAAELAQIPDDWK